LKGRWWTKVRIQDDGRRSRRKKRSAADWDGDRNLDKSGYRTSWKEEEEEEDG